MSADLQRARRAGDGERRRVLSPGRRDSTVATIWTSLRKSLGKSGRIGRSIIRLVMDRRLARPALTPGERPGDPARGVELLLVVARQREEVDALSRCLRGDRGDEHDGVAEAQHHRAVRLLGDVPGLDDQRACRRSPFQMSS